MKKILLRADDLGYSKGVNYGIYDCVSTGCIRNVGVMVNMGDVEHGIDLIRNFDIALGLHTNICNGKPVSESSHIKSLVDHEGNFISSKTYRNAKEDSVNYDEAVFEVNAQIEKFIQLIGRKPDYIDFHAAASTTFIKALEDVAKKWELKFNPLPPSFEDMIKIGDTNVFMRPGSTQDTNPFDLLKEFINEMNTIGIVVYHPGYLDQFIMNNSSLTFPRIMETAMLCSKETKAYIENYRVELITYKEL